MAYFTADKSSIYLQTTDQLDLGSMNAKFDRQLDNDVVIKDSFYNSIGIWQCSWYYDSTVKGYDFGDMVWLNTEEPDSFIQTHAEVIKQYTDNRAEILHKLPDFNKNDESVSTTGFMSLKECYAEVFLNDDIPSESIYRYIF